MSRRDVVIDQLTPELKAHGLRLGDVLKHLNQIEVSGETFAEVRSRLKEMEIGEHFELHISRSGQDHRIQVRVGSKPEMELHVFTILEDVDEETLALRKAWSTNLEHRLQAYQ